MDQELSLLVNINVKLVTEAIYTVGTTYPHAQGNLPTQLIYL